MKGYSLDSQIKFIRLLGVSPETSEHEIRKTFNEEVGIGEVVDIKKGFLDAEDYQGVQMVIGSYVLKLQIRRKLYLPISFAEMKENCGL